MNSYLRNWINTKQIKHASHGYAIALAMMFFICTSSVLAYPESWELVDLCRRFSKDLFDLNAKPYMSPTLSVVNSTSNAGASHSAYVPAKVNKPYFRFTVNTMVGGVPENMKTYKPVAPSKQFNLEDASKFLNSVYPNVSISDTAGLLNYLLQNVIYTGTISGEIVFPSSASTTLGNIEEKFVLSRNTLATIFKRHPIYGILPESTRQMLDGIIGGDGNLAFTLPKGGNVSSVIVPMPQVEVGSLFGTELLVRFIPPVSLGEWVGDFSFWGLGLKHSISQYFYDDPNRDGNGNRANITPFDLSIQAIYQHTSLENTVGVTNAKLTASANIFDLNVQFSKNFYNKVELYAGLSYENINIAGSYKYYLPVELQMQLGLLKQANENLEDLPPPTPEYPGDQVEQVSDVSLTDNQVKYNIGASCLLLDPVAIFVDYSVSKFNILTAGVQVRF